MTDNSKIIDSKRIHSKLVDYYLKKINIHKNDKMHRYMNECYDEDKLTFKSFIITDLNTVDYMKLLTRYPNDFLFEEILTKTEHKRYSMTIKKFEESRYPFWIYSQEVKEYEDEEYFQTNKLVIDIGEKNGNWHVWPIRSDEMIPVEDHFYYLMRLIRGRISDPTKYEIESKEILKCILSEEVKMSRELNG
jgi:hypothetical protein